MTNTSIEDILRRPEIGEKVVQGLSDDQLIRLQTDSFWQVLNNIRPKYWHHRLYEKYGKSELVEKLHIGLGVECFEDYVELIDQFNNILQCDSDKHLLTFETDRRADGPGTAPITQEKTTMSSQYLTYSTGSSSNVTIINQNTDARHAISSPHTHLRVFKDYILGYTVQQHSVNDVFVTLFDLNGNVLDKALHAEEAQTVFIYPTDVPEKMVLTKTEAGEEDSQLVEIFFLTVQGHRLCLTSIFKETFRQTIFTAYYAKGSKVVCFSHRIDSNDWDISVIDSRDATAEIIERQLFMRQASPLKSDILGDDGFACWPPIQMLTTSNPVFIGAFGVKMRFRSYHSGIQIMKRCRSAAFCVLDLETKNMKLAYLPLKPYFDIFVHDGFIQTVPHSLERRQTFGDFFKLVEHGDRLEIVQIPITQELDSFYPTDTSRVGFSVNGVANEDSIFLTIRTWPQRSAADISVKYRLLHFRWVPVIKYS